MKIKNRIVIVILGVLTALGSFAQERIENHYPDTIRMDVNEVEMIFAFNRISKKTTYYTDELWRSTINVMETAAENSAIAGGKKVSYRKVKKLDEEVGQVSVTPLLMQERYLIGASKTTSEELNRTEFVLSREDLIVTFSVNNASELQPVKELKIESLWQQIDQKYRDEGKNNLYGGTGKFTYGNANVEELGVLDTRSDNLEITFFGVGLGYYRDRFVPDLGSKLSFRIEDRLGNNWLEFGFLYTQQYFLTREVESLDYNLDLNGWLSGFLKLDNGKSNEFGVGIGSLIHKDGGFFQGSTWKLSVYADNKNTNFTFSPEIIFTNDFKEAFPAIRVGLSF